MNTVLKTILVCSFAALLAIPVSAQGIVSFSAASVANNSLQLDFTAGEAVSGSFSGESIALFTGSSSQSDFMPVSAEPTETGVPRFFRLAQNYPNPFNPSTTIQFDLPVTADVRLDVYNVIGVRVATLVNNHMQAGSHQLQFNASSLASGIYIYRLIANGAVIDTKKMTLVK